MFRDFEEWRGANHSNSNSINSVTSEGKCKEKHEKNEHTINKSDNKTRNTQLENGMSTKKLRDE